MRPLTLIGYFPKKVELRPNWLKAPQVTAIRSVSSCISEGPKGWIDHWTHNAQWLYSTIAAALAVVPEIERTEFELHAYKMLTAEFEDGQEFPSDIPPMEVEPLSEDFVSMGYDAVSRSGTTTFECSPLSCNHMAEKIATNEHCLIVELDAAIRTAIEFSAGDVEPGPYFVVEVFRQLVQGTSPRGRANS